MRVDFATVIGLLWAAGVPAAIALLIRAILRADRRERLALARLEQASIRNIAEGSDSSRHDAEAEPGPSEEKPSG